MNEAHPILPPPRLLNEWRHLSFREKSPRGFDCNSLMMIKAAQWGADQELDACCEWLMYQRDRQGLRAARRPKPLSTIEVAEEMIARHNDGWTPSPDDWVIIRDALADGRRAQEALSGD